MVKQHSDVRVPRFPGRPIHYALCVLHVHHFEMLEKVEHGREEYFLNVTQICEFRMFDFASGGKRARIDQNRNSGGVHRLDLAPSQI